MYRYPLQFEEQSYGHILLSLRLIPEKLLSANENIQMSIDKLIDSWDNYAVEMSALDIRGKMANIHQLKKIQPTYEFECWNQTQKYTQQQVKNQKLMVYIRKPSNPVFYSSLNIRVYEGKELAGMRNYIYIYIYITCNFSCVFICCRSYLYYQFSCILSVI